MAIRVAVMDGPDTDSIVTMSWIGLLNGDTGAAVLITKFADKTVQVVGAFGTGGTVVMQGSNDGGTTWGALSDLQGVLTAIQDNDPLVLAEDEPVLLIMWFAKSDCHAIRAVMAAPIRVARSTFDVRRHQTRLHRTLQAALPARLCLLSTPCDYAWTNARGIDAREAPGRHGSPFQLGCV